MSYIEEENSRIMCENAWKAITLTENWDFMGKTIESFSMSNDKRIKIISKKMSELGYNGHSGTSFGCTMRNMQYLVKNGEEKFKKLFNQEKQKKYSTNSSNSSLKVGDTSTFGNMTFVYSGGF
jgi:hypothetical protein